MRKFFKTIWRVITFPFVLLFNIIAFPFRGLSRIGHFLNEEPPEDRPLIDTFSSLATEAETRASLWEHVDALRMHLLRSIIGLALGVGISFYFTIPLMEYLAKPVGGLEKLQAIQVTEGISVYMRVALLSGVAIMLPYIAFELWLFAAPGLHPRDRKMGLLGIPLATLLFLMGLACTNYLLLPPALSWLANFTDIPQAWTANNYFGFVTNLMLWVGLFFEFPLAIYILTSIGLVKPQVLLQQWRLAIVIIAIVAAIITPTI
ncbi:MAG TPA: twin-arginine translocase subunit TatC, partial [Anaerolineales bacterium]|nr:twin-arginine translocase subunit TatC [Anaerolineales bacterium]